MTGVDHKKHGRFYTGFSKPSNSDLPTRLVRWWNSIYVDFKQPLYHGSRPGSGLGGGHVYDVNGNPQFTYRNRLVNNPDPAVDFLGEYAFSWCPFAADPYKQVEGDGRVHRYSNFVILAFWDRSGDSRFNAFSCFLLPPGTKDTVVAARHLFPWVFDRITFKIKV